MSYPSIDKLQKLLASEVFSHTKDPKKAAGRALGTLVEIITYYLLKTWGLERFISIERGLEEYGNSEITHNVEYTLHPLLQEVSIEMEENKTISSSTILKALAAKNIVFSEFERKSNNLLKENVLRNACTIATSGDEFLLASIADEKEKTLEINIYRQSRLPFAMFECKRVGVEEGMSKGPQTIEKAKQGAYVARTASSLQKIRTEKGELHGIAYKSDGTFIVKPFATLLDEIISSDDTELLKHFILTIGIVSNHGNWFTAENQNKELKVLAQSYDWLLFLTDSGLAEFIENLLLKPKKEYAFVRKVFLSSYSEGKKQNQFTKVQMNLEADALLNRYFQQNQKTIESWFNIISPKGKTLSLLKTELKKLTLKKWKEIRQ